MIQSRITLLTDAVKKSPAASKALPKPEKPVLAAPEPQIPNAKPKSGQLEDKVYLAIFRDMIQETKANLQSILEIYAANLDEGWNSAYKEAGNLSYAASQIVLDGWSLCCKASSRMPPPTNSRAPL